MTFELNQNVFGFIVKEIRNSTELNGRTVLLEHDKTGAGLFWVDNGAENMVFSITFRTLPEELYTSCQGIIRKHGRLPSLCCAASGQRAYAKLGDARCHAACKDQSPPYRFHLMALTRMFV